MGDTMKIKGINSELLYLPFVILAPIIVSVLFIIDGYLKVGIVILVGHFIPVIMILKEMNKKPKKTEN